MSQRERRDYRSLGEILSDARSERKMTVQQVSDRTKIAPRMIKSLENDELENLSGPVYARGFLRSLCQLYGLDHAWMMSKLEAGLETTNPAPTAPVVAPPPPRSVSESEPADEPPSDGGGPSEQTWKIEKVDSARVRRIRTRSERGIPRRVWGILIVLVALVVLVLLGRSLFSGDSSAWTAEGVDDAPTSGVTSMGTPESVPFAIATSAEPDTTDSAESTPPRPAASEPPVETADPEPESVEKAPPPRPAPPRVVDSAGTEDGEAERVHYDDEDESDGLVSVLRLDHRVPRQPSSLRIRATDVVEIWVGIDGREEYQRTLRAGDEVSYSGYRKFELDISDNENVVVELDGIRREPPWRLETRWVLHTDPPAPE